MPNKPSQLLNAAPCQTINDNNYCNYEYRRTLYLAI